MSSRAAALAVSKLFLVTDFGRAILIAHRNVIGRVLMLDGRPHTVIGVMPQGFQFPIQTDPIEMYITLAEDAASPDGSTPYTQQRGSHSLLGIGRLKPGVSFAQANAELRTIAAALEKKYPETNTRLGRRLSASPRRNRGRRPDCTLCFVWRGDLPAAHRERERRQSHARARLGARQRDRPARRPRRQPRPAHSPIADRKRAPGRPRRIARIVDCKLGNGRARRGRSAKHSASQYDPVGWSGAWVHSSPVTRDRHHFRPCPARGRHPMSISTPR